MVVFRQKLSYYNNTKVVVVGQKWFYSGKIGFYRENGCIWAKWLYSGKVVVFEESGCIRPKSFVFSKVVVFEQCACIRAKVAVFGQTGFTRKKMVVFEEK